MSSKVTTWLLCLAFIDFANASDIACSGSACARDGTAGNVLIQRNSNVAHEAVDDNSEDDDEDHVTEDEEEEDYDEDDELVLPEESGIVVKSGPWLRNGSEDAVNLRVEARQESSLLQSAGQRAQSARLPTASEKEGFLVMHNVYRCQHDVPDVAWSDAMAKSAHDYIKGMTSMKHSSSYSISPPAGPAGENLAMSSASLGAADAVSMWYSEVNDCQGGPEGFTDGCANGAGGKATGHFTALIWKGVKEIGCAFSDSTSPTLVICRYKAGNSLSMDTPNMNKPGNYPNHVFPRKNSEEKCEGGAGGNQKKPAPSGGGGGGAAAPEGKCKKNCAKGKKTWPKKCKKTKCAGCEQCAAAPDADPPAATPAPTKAVTATPVSGACLVSNPDWPCKGSMCVGNKYKMYSAAGGKWCLTGASSYCKKQDSGWCGGSCSCPGSCAHACGRCPPP